jgi:hypothetical protein
MRQIKIQHRLVDHSFFPFVRPKFTQPSCNDGIYNMKWLSKRETPKQALLIEEAGHGK